jgi:hypothetical protein
VPYPAPARTITTAATTPAPRGGAQSVNGAAERSAKRSIAPSKPVRVDVLSARILARRKLRMRRRTAFPAAAAGSDCPDRISG